MGTPFGFPDWQKQSPLDGPLLIDVNVAAQLPNNQMSMVYVGRWASVAGLVETATWPTVWTFAWYADQAGTKQLGQRKFVTDPGIVAPARLMFTNLGPWLRISYSTTSPGPTITQTVFLYGTNRRAALPFDSGRPLLSVDNAVAIAAGATAQVWPLGYHAGPAELWATCNQQYNLNLFSYNDTNTLVLSNQWVANAAGVAVRQEVILPTGAFRLDLVNTGAAAGVYYLTLAPSLTGSG